MNINNTKRHSKSIVDITGVATVTKEMNASLHMLVKLKQVNPSLNGVDMEFRLDGRQEGGQVQSSTW